MLFVSPVYSQASGSTAGITYAHNRGGLYTRARRTPVNTNTVQQQAVRNAVAQCATAWQSSLTAAQRTAWETYAMNVPLIGPLGTTRDVGGIAMYVRSNVPRLQASVARVDAGPTAMALPTLTTPTMTVVGGGTTASLTFTNADAWANEVGGYMLIYISRQQSPSTNFFAGPYRFAGKLTGAGTPPTSPATITLPFAIATANKLFFRVEVTRADGRLSASFRNGITAS